VQEDNYAVYVNDDELVRMATQAARELVKTRLVS
jgi:hypothetical protein